MKSSYTSASLRVGLWSLAIVSGFSIALPAQTTRNNPFRPPNAQRRYARTRDYDVRHLQVILDVDAQNRSAQGVVTHYLTPLRKELSRIVLDAGSNLKIGQCFLNGANAAFTHEKDSLTVLASAPLSNNKEVVLQIRYTMPNQNVTAGSPNGAAGWHWILENPNTPERRPGFWTQGETQGNRFWVPLYDAPNDFCTSETVVTVPDHWLVIGNGSEGKTVQDKAKRTKTYRWTMNKPHATYLLSLAGGELDIKKDSWQGVPLYYVVPKGKANLIDASFSDTPDMLTFFSKVTGVKYAWSKYAQNAMYDFGGGMENVSATTLGAGSLTDARSGNRNMSGLNSHELAHQWFGDLVTCEDWGDVWLNESFATFFEALYHEHAKGKEQYEQEIDGFMRGYFAESRRYKRPLATKFYGRPESLFDSHAYPKGAAVLHTLRRQLGDEDFFKGIKNYLQRFAHRPVQSHNLMDSITEATGVNVEPFFEQWVNLPGHPVLETSWKYDEAEKMLIVSVKQAQDTSDGTPIYDMPLTVGFYRSGSAFERQTVRLNQAEQTFRVPCPSRPEAVLTDPDHDMLRELKATWAETELPNILRYAPNMNDRQAALTQITQKGSLTEGQISLLQSALSVEPSEVVSGGILAALGRTKSESLRPLYRQELASKVAGRRYAAITALTALPIQAEDIETLRKIANSDTERYNIVQTALSTLAKQNSEAHLPIFRHQLAAVSINDTLAFSVLRYAEGVKSLSPLFLEAVQNTKLSAAVRRSAISTLGEKEGGSAMVQNALVALLKEENAPVQLAAISALKGRKEESVRSALQALASGTKNERVAKAAREVLDAKN